jgi:hypothetical protein
MATKMSFSLDIELGEGETERGTVLFPDDPTRRLEIVWKDPERKRRPKPIQISSGKSLWQTIRGISLGTTLQEQRNGRGFLLAGFAWDYSGTLQDWRHAEHWTKNSAPGSVLRCGCHLQRIPRVTN